MAINATATTATTIAIAAIITIFDIPLESVFLPPPPLFGASKKKATYSMFSATTE
jgi:hypothetical protein